MHTYDSISVLFRTVSCKTGWQGILFESRYIAAIIKRELRKNVSQPFGDCGTLVRSSALPQNADWSFYHFNGRTSFSGVSQIRSLDEQC